MNQGRAGLPGAVRKGTKTTMSTKTKKPPRVLTDHPATSPEASPATAAAARATIESGTFKPTLDLLRAHPHNPREGTDPDLEALVASMKGQGLLEPILVRRVDDEREAYVVLSGHRRWKAAEKLGWLSIDAREVKTDDAGALAIVLTANQQRLELDPVREGASLAELVRLSGGIKEAAARIGRTVPYVAERIGLPGLSKDWQKRFHERPWSLWPLRAWALLAGMVPEQQDAFAASSRVKMLLDDPMIDPKELEGELADWVRVLGKAPFPIEDAALVPQAGACGACPKQSQHRPGLFDTGEPVDLRAARCGDRACWELKSRRFLQARVATAKKEHGADLVVTLPDSHLGRAPQGVRVLQSHAYSKAKKGEKGAVPAISATAKGTEVSYVKVRKPSGPSGAHTERAKGPSLEDVRGQFEARQKMAALEAVCVHLTKRTPTARQLLAYVHAHGWESALSWQAKDNPEKTAKAMEEVLGCKTDDQAALLLWEGMEANDLVVSAGGTHVWGTGKQQVQQAAERLGKVMAIAAVLGVKPADLEAPVKEAVSKVKRPAALDQAEAKAAPDPKPAKARKGARGKAAAAGDSEQAQVDEARAMGTEEQDHASREATGASKPRAKRKG